jgi:hypothetical protein
MRVQGGPAGGGRHGHVVKSQPGPPMTLGNAAAARFRLIVWCKECQHQGNPAEMAARYGAEMPVLDWRERLVCSRCGSREVDMVVRVKCARGLLLPPRIMSQQTVHCSSLVVAPIEGDLVVPNVLHSRPRA